MTPTTPTPAALAVASAMRAAGRDGTSTRSRDLRHRYTPHLSRRQFAQALRELRNLGVNS